MAKRGSGDGRERDRRAGKGEKAPGDAHATGDGKPGKVKREQARAARKAERDERRVERESRKIERELQKMERRLVEAQAIIVDVAQRAEALDGRLRSLRGEAARTDGAPGEGGLSEHAPALARTPAQGGMSDSAAVPAATHEDDGAPVPAAGPAGASDTAPEPAS